MKRKIFKVAAAAMAVVCLAGCSAGSFTSKSMISAAKKYGMEECAEMSVFAKVNAGTGYNASMYHVSENAEQADAMCFAFTGFGPEAGIEEFVACAETYAKTDDKGALLTHVYYINAKDEETAQKIYDYKVKTLQSPVEGQKNGVNYVISYEFFEADPSAKIEWDIDTSSGDKNGPVPLIISEIPESIFDCEITNGVYIKGNKVILIYSMYDASEKNDCVKTFCDSLGLVSPYTLKES